MSSTVLHPELPWAQRSSESEPEKNIIYLTIQTPDIQGEPKLDITESHISFAADCGAQSKGVPEKRFAFEIDLFEDILPEETKKHVTSRAIMLILRKKEAKSEYWPRLTKEKVKNMWIKTDFSKWVDEDDQDTAEAIDESQFAGGQGGPPGMGGMGGMPGMEGMGMPGMGGMGGGAGGMDFASMMQGMGGAGGGGEGGAGGMDFAKMLADMKASGQLPADMPELDEDEDHVEEDDDAEVETGDKGKGKETDLDDVE
ncbi:hypothetical protein P7C73_g5537, partial [Tremellales sp. Uapishka_1]